MEKLVVTLLLCIYCATVCCVSAQQSGTLPSIEDNKKSEDTSKFTPITTSNSPKFSIGLGVLSPSYSQKFGIGDEGKMKLDFTQDSGGYSYSLNSLAQPVAKSTDRSGSDDKMKTADASQQLTPSSQYNPTSYSLSTGSGSRSDFSSIGTGYSSQAAPPVPQSYAPNYGPGYGPISSYGPPGYGPMPYPSYPNSGPQYSQTGAYNPSPIAPVASNIQSSPAQLPYNPSPVASAPAPQPYPPPQPQTAGAQYNPYMAQMPNPYGFGQSMSPYSLYSQPPQPAPQASPYGGYGSQYGGGYGSPYGGAGYGMYGSPSQSSPSSYPYGGGGGNDPLASMSPEAINTLRQLYGASSSMSMSYMSPYSGMSSGMGGGGAMGGYGGGSGYGGYGGGSSGLGSGGLSSLISLFG